MKGMERPMLITMFKMRFKRAFCRISPLPVRKVSTPKGKPTTNKAQSRWPDIFSTAINTPEKAETGVLNLGIGDNRILSVGLGTPGKERFDRDILGQHGLHSVIIFEAINDIGTSKNLYDFWGEDIWTALLLEEIEERLQKEGEKSLENGNPMLILNLASKEYSKCIEKYLPKDRILRKKIMWKDETKELSFPIHYISCGFYEKSGEKLVQKGVYAKMARGEMVRYLAENKIENAEEIKGFKGLDFNFEDKLSTEDQYIFLRK